METTSIISDILSFAGALIWAGIILLAFSTLIGKALADIWFQKERTLYQDEIEEYKALIAEFIGSENGTVNFANSNSSEPSKFDREAVFYEGLSESGLALVEAIEWLFPRRDELPRDENGRKNLLEKRYDEAVANYNKFLHQLGKATPFINKDIYYLFDRLRKETHHQILFFPDIRIRKHGDVIKEKSAECYANTAVINEHYQETMNKLRNYISLNKNS